MQVRSLIARTAVRLLDRLSAVRPRDLTSEHGTSRPGQAGIGIGARGSAVTHASAIMRVLTDGLISIVAGCLSSAAGRGNRLRARRGDSL
jgi:hypothetical protein